MKLKEKMVGAIIKEIQLTSNYLPEAKIDSIYFGGGTPSLLSTVELEKILDVLAQYYSWPDAEITLEANPDDISLQKARDFLNLGVNRWSIGVQSFHDQDLKLMRRAHSASESKECIQTVRKAGFENFSIDLIYGTPGLSYDLWQKNVNRAMELEVPHLSAYALTVEEKTLLHHQVKKGVVTLTETEDYRIQFDYLMDKAELCGLEHYEISNYSLPGYRAIHNSSYWKRKPYLGIGPSAHSFNRGRRRWNIANNALYIQALENEKHMYEEEELTLIDHINEYLMTGLRTVEGVDLSRISDKHLEKINQGVNKLIDLGLLIINQSQICLTREGKHLADFVTRELFITED